jgi:hypothetical protein
MANAVIGALRVDMGLDSAQFSRGAGRAKSELSRLRGQFMLVAGAAAAFGTAIVAAALAGAREIDRVAKAARRLDTSIGGFRALELAAKDAGVSAGSLANELQNIEREIAKVGTEAGGNAARALRRLGMSTRDLIGLDADEKIAVIADRVQELGLTTGEASILLQDLGVRNREMVLLLRQGGSAIRTARDDIADYGLALSEVDARKIEQANDQISRLGLVSTYAGQVLAQALVPALGRMAEAITNSLREGGALRAVIDGVAGSMDRILITVGAAVAVIGTRYVAALVAAKVATLSLATATGVLRTALVRSGIGLVIVGVGELVYQLTVLDRSFTDVGRSIGDSFRQAWDTAKSVALEALNRIRIGGQALVASMQAVGLTIEAVFIEAFARIAEAWADLTSGMAGAFNTVLEFAGFEGRIEGLGTEFAASVRRGANEAVSEARRASAESVELWRQAFALPTGGAGGLPVLEIDAGRPADADLLAFVRGIEAALDDAAASGLEAADAVRALLGAGENNPLQTAIDNLNHALATGAITPEEFADLTARVQEFFAATDGGARGASGAIDELNAKLTETAEVAMDGAKRITDMMAATLTSIITGAETARDAIGRLLQQFAQMALNSAFQALIGGAFGGGGFVKGLAGLIGANANGTPNWRGGATWVGERGPELVNLPRGSQIHDAQSSARMGGPVEIVLNVQPSGEFDARVENTSSRIAARVVRAAGPGIVGQSLRSVMEMNRETGFFLGRR